MKLFTLFIIIFLNIAGLSAQSVYTIQSSNMNIKGTSTLHDWEVKATTIRGKCEMRCEGQIIKEIKSFYLEIPTKGLKSDNGSKMMDDKVYSALKSDAVQNIIFRLEKVISISPTANGWDVIAKGNFGIAGVNSSDNMIVHVKMEANGSITLSGAKMLKMLDYNVEPPKAMLGALTTGNEIEVEFKINLIKVKA